MEAKNTYRFRVHEYLDAEGRTAKHRAFNFFIIMLIFANVIAVILESHAPYRTQYSSYFFSFEIFSVIVFTFEYLGRIWSCVDNETYGNTSPLKARIRYLFSPLAIIDLLAILPFYLSFFIAIDMRYLRMLRMLRLLKLSHYFKGLDIFITVISKEIVTIATVILTVLIMVILSASLMYTIEHSAQPEAFKDIPHAIWWAVVTMTTVGYGDVTPVTFPGRVLAGFIMLLGVGVVALPAGMLAARFGEEIQMRKDRMRTQVLHALEDGKIEDWEMAELEKTARHLGISTDSLNLLIDLHNIQRTSLQKCPHCGKAIDKDSGDLD
mgnify:FL=1